MKKKERNQTILSTIPIYFNHLAYELAMKPVTLTLVEIIINLGSTNKFTHTCLFSM